MHPEIELRSYDVSRTRIVSLDYLRGCAIFLVLIAHFDIIESQGIAVDLFFNLSAFTLSSSFLKQLHNKRNISYGAFLQRRAWRILPSYFFFLLFGRVLAYFFIQPINSEAVYSLRELPQYLFFFRNYGGQPVRMAFEHLWSLSVEVQFYLLLPLLFILVQKYYQSRLQVLTTWVCGLILLGVSIKITAFFTGFADWPTYSHNRMDTFAWGILTSILVYQRHSVIQQLMNNKWVALAGVMLLTVACFIKLIPDQHNLILRCIAPFCWSLIILGLYNWKFAGFYFLQILSRYSYNIYLWHFLMVVPVVYYLNYSFPGFLLYLGLTAIAAYLTTHLIERKFTGLPVNR